MGKARIRGRRRGSRGQVRSPFSRSGRPRALAPPRVPRRSSRMPFPATEVFPGKSASPGRELRTRSDLPVRPSLQQKILSATSAARRPPPGTHTCTRPSAGSPDPASGEVSRPRVAGLSLRRRAAERVPGLVSLPIRRRPRARRRRPTRIPGFRPHIGGGESCARPTSSPASRPWPWWPGRSRPMPSRRRPRFRAASTPTSPARRTRPTARHQELGQRRRHGRQALLLHGDPQDRRHLVGAVPVGHRRPGYQALRRLRQEGVPTGQVLGRLHRAHRLRRHAVDSLRRRHVRHALRREDHHRLPRLRHLGRLGHPPARQGRRRVRTSSAP